MSKDRRFDFWYAVNNTQVLRLPSNRLETFGTSVVHYHLLTELMDSTDKVRVREGKIEAFRPRLITPDLFNQSALEGFGEEAVKYTEWLQSHRAELLIMQYGFAIKKTETHDHIVTDKLQAVTERVQEDLKEKDDPLSALLVGVDEPWEVCLIKLMVEVVQQSVPGNARDLVRDPNGHRHEIENLFEEAARDPGLVSYLHRKLEEHQLFAEYEDRFFSLVKS